MTHIEILALRKSLGLTQAEMAERLGVHAQTVYQWEAGRRSPTGLYLKALERLADEHDHAHTAS